eukprot:387288_1
MAHFKRNPAYKSKKIHKSGQNTAWYNTKSSKKNKKEQFSIPNKDYYYYQNVTLGNGETIILTSCSRKYWQVLRNINGNSHTISGSFKKLMHQLSLQISYDDMVHVIKHLNNNTSSSRINESKSIQMLRFYPAVYISQLYNAKDKTILITGYSRINCRYIIADSVCKLITQYVTYLIYNEKDYYVNCNDIKSFNCDNYQLISSKYNIRIMNFAMKYGSKYSIRACLNMFEKDLNYFDYIMIGVTDNPQSIIKNKCCSNFINEAYYGWTEKIGEYQRKYVIEMIVDLKKKSKLIMTKPVPVTLEDQMCGYHHGRRCHYRDASENNATVTKQMQFLMDINKEYYAFVALLTC